MGSITRRVVTFYSFKGGVGRSFALCDVAVFLARWGYEVLCVDFDLEAPGLDRYFAPWLPPSDEAKPGMLDILEAWAAEEPDEDVSRAAAQWLNVPGTDQRLALITAGRRDLTYVRRLHAIDWAHLFDEQRMAGRRLEALRERCLEQFDIVLVDSRTGWSDIGEICTIHLPDVLVTLFTPSVQSIEGAIEVADASKNAVGRLPVDRAPLRVVPVLTRVDKDEYESQQEWTHRLLEDASRFVDDWDPQEDTPAGVLAELVVPYVPYWAYGERLAALRAEAVPALSVGRAHENLAALLARGLSEAGLLLKHRDSYVDGASVGASSATTLSARTDYDAYISYPRGHSQLALDLAHALRKRGIEVFVDRLALQLGDDWQDVLTEAQGRSRTFVTLLDGAPIGFHAGEIAAILDRVAQGQARLIPIVLSGWEKVPPNLSRFQSLILSEQFNAEKIADQLYSAILRMRE